MKLHTDQFLVAALSGYSSALRHLESAPRFSRLSRIVRLGLVKSDATRVRCQDPTKPFFIDAKRVTGFQKIAQAVAPSWGEDGNSRWRSGSFLIFWPKPRVPGASRDQKIRNDP